MKQHLLCSLFQITLEDSVTTCLSPSVYEMICTLGFELRENRDIDSIVTRDGEVCWGTITECVTDTGPGLPCSAPQTSVRAFHLKWLTCETRLLTITLFGQRMLLNWSNSRGKGWVRREGMRPERRRKFWAHWAEETTCGSERSGGSEGRQAAERSGLSSRPVVQAEKGRKYQSWIRYE